MANQNTRKATNANSTRQQARAETASVEPKNIAKSTETVPVLLLPRPLRL